MSGGPGMTKEQFEVKCLSLGFERDSEYPEMWRVPWHGCIYVTWVSFHMASVNYGMEYSWLCRLTEKRLIALKEAFEV